VFDEQERILHVCNREKHSDTKKYFWNDVARIELDNVSEINWTHIECGETLSAAVTTRGSTSLSWPAKAI
jgi:hypothetical protein